MQTQVLNSNWQISQVDLPEWIPAEVPGSVHTDLMAAGRLADPFYSENENQAQWVAEKDWQYRTFFHPTQAVMAQERIYLVCDGLDTLADVRLNGKILGSTDNMFRSWEWEVKDLLLEGENRLEILFRSPLAHTRLRNRVKPMAEMGMGIAGGPHLRKAPSHFGWDWGPRLPGVGIWREVRLEGRNQGRLADVRFEQVHESGQVMLHTRVQSELWREVEGQQRSIRLRVTGPDRQVWQADAPARAQQTIPLLITNPQLWWPNGLGDQPLYRVEVELMTGEETAECQVYHLGLRTLELRQEEDEWGRSFRFVVNGVPVFCKGANWIPADSFVHRAGPARLEGLVRAAAAANYNMLRVWGGGYYESEPFYDLCDRYGILVWQDLQFACATYPLDDPAYVESVLQEVRDNAQRLRHHASLALWCGNNEIEMLAGLMGWQKKHDALLEAMHQFFHQKAAELLAEEDPGRPYWPGSPSSGASEEAPNNEKTGDAHLWEVYHMFRPPSFYRTQHPRFVSEFGFQSLPAAATIERFAPQQDWRLNSATMNHRQRAPSGNKKLLWYLGQRMRIPRSFEDLIYASQIFQAEVVRTGVEHWRRQPERTSGALYWQFNDCWPAISWSSIDYDGRWKALHYAARRFFAPVLLSVEDQLEKGQKKMAVWLSNDTRESWSGTLRWTLETLDGEVLEGGHQPVYAGPVSAGCLLRLDFARKGDRPRKIDWRKVVFVAELWDAQEEQRLALQVCPFRLEKDMPLGKNPLRLTTQVQDGRLIVRLHANQLARFVFLTLGEGSAVFSDNAFDLPAGREMIVDCPMPAGWTEEMALAGLQVRSLGEIGPCESRATSGPKRAWALAQCLAATAAQILRK
jgi:beta-mannosidase